MHLLSVFCVLFPEMLQTKEGEDEKGTSMIPTPRGKESSESCRFFFSFGKPRLIVISLGGLT